MYAVLFFLAATTALGARSARDGRPPARTVLIALSVIVALSMASLKVV